MNIVAFIPARGGSKSIPRKNIKELGGKPLIAYSIESAMKCGVSQVIVNTDDKEIEEIAMKNNAKVMIRSLNISKDNTSMFDVLKNEIPKITPLPDLVLLLQPTSPFRKASHIQIAISYLSNNLDKFDSVVSVERVPEKYNPYAMILENSHSKIMMFRKLMTLKEKIVSWMVGKKFIGPNLNGYPISQRMIRRQDFPQAWIPDGSIYLFKTENLKNGSIYGETVMLLESEGSININAPDDWIKAEEYLKSKSNANNS